MAIVINGSGTVTGLAVGGLPDGTVDSGTLATDSVSLTEMASGIDGNIISYDASGNPVAIATGSDGQVLTSTGAGSPPAFEALPAGGLSEADTWYLDTAFNVSNNSTNVLTNLSRTGTAMGTGMTESSGIFTFPSTGFWLITFQTAFRNSATERYWYSYINESTNSGSSYGVALQNASNSLAGGTNTYTMNNISLIRDVTNISTYRASFSVFAGNGQSGHVIQSGVSTNMRFVKLGET